MCLLFEPENRSSPFIRHDSPCVVYAESSHETWSVVIVCQMLPVLFSFQRVPKRSIVARVRIARVPFGRLVRDPIPSRFPVAGGCANFHAYWKLLLTVVTIISWCFPHFSSDRAAVLTIALVTRFERQWHVLVVPRAGKLENFGMWKGANEG